MELITFIPEQLIILSVCLWILGDSIKNASLIRNEYIPFVLMFTGITFSLIIVGPTAKAALQGIICAGLAIESDQTFKQYKKLKKQDL